MRRNKQILWGLIALLLAVASVAAMLAQSGDLTLSDLFAALKEASFLWLVVTNLCVFGYIFFEGVALWYLLKKCGFNRRLRDGITYACADIYCAAITPSATGGQPACGWFMVRDGIPGGFMTAILTVYLMVHSVASLAMGLTALVMEPAVFAGFSLLSKLLILFGYVMITALAVLFISLLRHDEKIRAIGHKIVAWLKRKNVIKMEQYWHGRLNGVMDDYHDGVQLMRGKGDALVVVFLLNVLQRFSQTAVSSCMYMATGGDRSHFDTVFVTQIFSTVGSMCLPVPGGMGVADYLLFNGLNAIMRREDALRLELLSRSFSFYLCILLSLGIMIAGYIVRRKYYFTVRRGE